MWNLYSRPNSIAIRIKYSHFKEQLLKEHIDERGYKKEVVCSPIRYIDYQSGKSIIQNQSHDPVFMKDISFDHEKEFRIVMKEEHREIPPINYKENISRRYIENFHNKIYEYPGYKLNLKEFDNYKFEIVHHPKSEQWAKDNIHEVVKKFNINFKVFDSNLELN